MTSPSDWIRNDDDLLAELARALPNRDLTERISHAAKGVYSWRTMDAELASLAYDSVVHGEAGVRSEAASVRTMTFESESLIIDLCVLDDALIGQLAPPGRYQVSLRRPSGPQVEVAVDDLGCFRIVPVPTGAFGLCIEGSDGMTVATGWVSL
jgi:hypothetical protein